MKTRIVKLGRGPGPNMPLPLKTWLRGGADTYIRERPHGAIAPCVWCQRPTRKRFEYRGFKFASCDPFCLGSYYGKYLRGIQQP